MASNLLVFGSAHAAVDAVCAAVLFGLLASQNVSAADFVFYALTYNFLAFGLQPFLGYALDKRREPRLAAAAGCLIVFSSFLAASASTFASPVLAVALAGFGNALFHVGGGTISLNLTRRGATAPGLFVAPGALGLFVGTMIGRTAPQLVWLPAVLALLACAAIFIVKIPEIDYSEKRVSPKFEFFELVVILLLLSVAIRSLVGFVMVLPWKSDSTLLVALTASIVLGKGLGGILADKLGWLRFSVGALLVSAPLLSFGANSPLLALAGVFLFNTTMPVTLVAVANTIPGKPGFAFGLTCLALLAGSILGFTQAKTFFGGPAVLMLVVAASAAFLLIGLKKYGGIQTANQKTL